MSDTVQIWVYEDDIQINPEGTMTGDPCLLIPANKEAVWRWFVAMIDAIEEGDMEQSVPGRFAKITEDEL